MINEVAQQTWFRGWTFSFAVAGVAVGMHSFWRLPLLALENGGSAFLLAYVLSLVLLAAPLLAAEIMLGRSAACEQMEKPFFWRGLVFLGCITSLLVLSNLSVFGSLSLSYGVEIASGELMHISADEMAARFNALLSSSERMAGWLTLFIAIPAAVLLLGVSRGTGFAMRLLIPLGLLLLLVLVAHNVSSGALDLGNNVLYEWRPDEFGWYGLKQALMLAFFSVSIGVGAVLALSNYMPPDQPARRALMRVVLLILVFSILSGLVIYPLLQNAGVAMGEGPTLLFLSMPMAFAKTVQGDYYGSLFFVLISSVAIASAIALLEPLTRALVRLFLLHRLLAVVTAAVSAWLIALPSMLSFNEWHNETRTAYEWLDLSTSLVLIPLAVLWICQLQAIQVGTYLLQSQNQPRWRRALLLGWQSYLRYITPLALLALVYELAQQRGLLA
jgi:NSS family neurotransmitter:Na+ symporter